MGDLPAGRREAAVVGSLLGGAVSGLAMQLIAPAHLVLVGAIAGLTSLSGGFAVWLLVALVLGGGFALLAESTVDVADALADGAKVGLGYGVATALVVGLVVVPAVAGAVSKFHPPIPMESPTIVVSYVLYGLVLGTLYGGTLYGMVPAFGVWSDRGRATVAGSLLGGVGSGLVLVAAAPFALARLSAALQLGPSVAAGFGVWLAFTVILGIAFSKALAKRVEGTGMLVRAGLIYGVVAAVGLGAIAVPSVTAGATRFEPAVPLLAPVVLGAYVLYGLLLGVGYAVGLRRGHLLPGEVGERSGPLLAGALAGTVVGGGFLAAVVGIKYLVYLGVTFQLGATVARAWLAWVLLAGVLSVAFVRTIAPDPGEADLVGTSVRRGALFGGVAGGVVVALLPPVLSGATEYGFGMTAQNPLIFLGYLLFGIALGGGYGLSIGGFSPSVGTETQRAVVFGSLLGAFTGGLVVHHLAGRVWIQYVGSIVGVAGSIGYSWLAWIGLCLALGTAFASFVDANIDAYVNSLTTLTARDERVRAVAEPAVRNAALTSTAAGMGVLFGVAAAVVVGTLAVPLLVNLATPFGVAVPALEPFVVLGYVTFGLFLGVGYGTVLEF